MPSQAVVKELYSVGLSLRDRGLLKPEEWLLFALLKSEAETPPKRQQEETITTRLITWRR